MLYPSYMVVTFSSLQVIVPHQLWENSRRSMRDAGGWAYPASRFLGWVVTGDVSGSPPGALRGYLEQTGQC